MAQDLNRREPLRAAVLLPLVAVAAPTLVGCGGSGPVCDDPDLLSTPERQLRKSLGYAESSPHGETKRCAGCQFFEAAAAGACGQCEIMNGPVNPAGHCSSWAARA